MMFIGEKTFLLATVLVIQVTGSGLWGRCEINENCGTLDTHCNNGTCVCLEDFVTNTDTCNQMSASRTVCKNKKECYSVLGTRSLCKEGKCACKSFHHLYQGQCIKSRGLDEMCEHHHQCYCGQKCQDKIECFEGMCRCRNAHKQQSRLCIAEPSETIISVKINTTSIIEEKTTFITSSAFKLYPMAFTTIVLVFLHYF